MPSEIAPEDYERLGLSPELYRGLNSPNYFTIYPPVNQVSFAIAALPHQLLASVWLLKLSILIAEVLSLFLIIHLLSVWKKPLWWAGYYALNPLVIIELTGNIHFEAWMVCGLLGSLAFLASRQWVWAALAFGIAIASKLLPLLLLPFFIRKLGWSKSLAFGAIAVAPTIAGFALMPQPEAVLNIFNSIGLYFENFEFNAAVYRWLLWLGADGLIWGKVLGLIAAGGILALAFFRKRIQIIELPVEFLLALSMYFFLARIVHPWYICPLVALAGFGSFRFPVVWTALLPLTYLTYQTEEYQQPYEIMTLCWLIVLGLAWREFRKK
ncbi:MAG: glycosyltransferase 87 family protein [Bacteroidia bacterium]